MVRSELEGMPNMGKYAKSVKQNVARIDPPTFERGWVPHTGSEPLSLALPESGVLVGTPHGTLACGRALRLDFGSDDSCRLASKPGRCRSSFRALRVPFLVGRCSTGCRAVCGFTVA
jgi:hypothetical protein